MSFWATAQYDQTFSRRNTWIGTPTGVRVRVDVTIVCKTRECVIDIPLRHAKTASESPGCVFVQRIDDAGTRWLLNRHDYGSCVGEGSIILVGCPAWVSDHLSRL